MTTIAELKRKIRNLQKRQDELLKQECALQDEIRDIEREKWLDKVKKNIHVGDIRMINQGVTQYHCNVINIYEILSVTPHVHRYKRNGISSTYTAYGVMVREFTIHATDNDRISCIEVKQCCDIDTLLKAKKISKEDFEEFKSTILLDPRSYDESKWNPKGE